MKNFFINDPILDNIDNIKVAEDNRDVLKGFYGVLKSSEEYLRFVFLTGVSKFSKTSVFSELNNFDDLSLDNQYSEICGISESELNEYFADYIEEYSKEKNITYDEAISNIKRWYDGYSWDGENRLYNPYSLLGFFKKKELGNYWFETGTPNFLVKILKRNVMDIEDPFEAVTLFDSDFTIFDVEKIKQIPLLFQSGYLTIVKKEDHDGRIEYTLAVPNFEVEESLNKNLFDEYYENTEKTFKNLKNDILEELKDGSCESFYNKLRLEIANIPYWLKIRDWRYYQSIAIIAMRSLGFEVDSEMATHDGRIDSVIKNSFVRNDSVGTVIIVEMKYSQQDSVKIDNLIDKAFNQVYEKKYWEKYLNNDLIVLALAFKQNKTRLEIKCKIKVNKM
ncbi:MAG: ATP-binding protein [Methanobrevibacter sp.]|jgi:hypothetical protein|nr:ATP-binding protein [Candidatus Methanovirga meridionalis]